MKFLADIRIPDRKAAEPFLKDHLAYLNAHFDSGDFLMFAAYANGEGGMLIAQADSREAMDALLAADPLHSCQSVRYQTTEMKIGRVCVQALTE